VSFKVAFERDLVEPEPEPWIVVRRKPRPGRRSSKQSHACNSCPCEEGPPSSMGHAAMEELRQHAHLGEQATDHAGVTLRPAVQAVIEQMVRAEASVSLTFRSWVVSRAPCFVPLIVQRRFVTVDWYCSRRGFFSTSSRQDRSCAMVLVTSKPRIRPGLCGTAPPQWPLVQPIP
jgi:hypothetical protein